MAAAVVAKVLPSVAVVFSNIQLTSPLRVVLICRKYNNLGSLNPVPWAVAFINCLGYMMYGCLTKNPYVMASVTLGLPINYFAVSSAISILGKGKEPTHNRLSWKIDSIVLLGLGLWIIVAFVIGAVLPAVLSGDVDNTALTIIGYVTITTCMLYYAAPLSVLMEIIKNKDAAGLYTPMIVMNFLTSTLWAVYGFVFIGDAVVYAPNMFAMLLSAAQLTLKFTYPSIDPTKLQRRMSKVSEEDSDTEHEVTFTSSPGDRPRAGSCTQDILCADGTVGVLEFSPEEAQERNHRSSTITSLAEVILDTIDIMSPRRHPADVVEVRRGEHDDLFSPRGRRGSSFSSPGSAPLARSPVRRMSITTQLDSPSHGTDSFGSAHSRGRRRSSSDAVLPVIDEERPLETDLHLIAEPGTYTQRPARPAKPNAALVSPGKGGESKSPPRRAGTTAPLLPGSERSHSPAPAAPQMDSPLHTLRGATPSGRPRAFTRDSPYDAAAQYPGANSAAENEEKK